MVVYCASHMGGRNHSCCTRDDHVPVDLFHRQKSERSSNGTNCGHCDSTLAAHLIHDWVPSERNIIYVLDDEWFMAVEYAEGLGGGSYVWSCCTDQANCSPVCRADRALRADLQ